MKPGAQRPDLPGATVAFSPGDFDLAPFHRFPSFQMKKHNVCVQVHKSADPAAWPLLPLVAHGWPSLSAGSPHAPPQATTASPAPPQSSSDIPHPASSQNRASGGLEKLFLWCEDQDIQSQTGLRVCPSPPLRSRAVEKAERRQGPRRGLQGASQVTMAY